MNRMFRKLAEESTKGRMASLAELLENAGYAIAHSRSRSELVASHPDGYEIFAIPVPDGMVTVNLDLSGLPEAYENEASLTYDWSSDEGVAELAVWLKQSMQRLSDFASEVMGVRPGSERPVSEMYERPSDVPVMSAPEISKKRDELLDQYNLLPENHKDRPAILEKLRALGRAILSSPSSRHYAGLLRIADWDDPKYLTLNNEPITEEDLKKWVETPSSVKEVVDNKNAPGNSEIGLKSDPSKVPAVTNSDSDLQQTQPGQQSQTQLPNSTMAKRAQDEKEEAVLEREKHEAEEDRLREKHSHPDTEEEKEERLREKSSVFIEAPSSTGFDFREKLAKSSGLLEAWVERNYDALKDLLVDRLEDSSIYPKFTVEWEVEEEGQVEGKVRAAVPNATLGGEVVYYIDVAGTVSGGVDHDYVPGEGAVRETWKALENVEMKLAGEHWAKVSEVSRNTPTTAGHLIIGQRFQSPDHPGVWEVRDILDGEILADAVNPFPGQEPLLQLDRDEHVITVSGPA